ncbi:hypothetical protein DDI_1108 [Dickeya dianthicola RNS04.9]|nr:hypothetical protein DDI_1108 [Dickeya dianthicola RNS04.9]
MNKDIFIFNKHMVMNIRDILINISCSYNNFVNSLMRLLNSQGTR